MKLTITKIGDSDGIVLPKDFLERMRLKTGDSIELSYTDIGALISPDEDYFDEAMAHTERVMEENDDALKRLAE